MANRTQFYFDEVLLCTDLNTEFGNLESADWAAMSDQGLVGLIWGGTVTPSLSAASCTVAAFAAYDQLGKRIYVGGSTTCNFTDDVTGTPTIPSSSNYRWISIVARYGKDGTTPVTDGDGATVYTVQTEGESSTGDVNLATTPGNFGQMRVLSGTQNASPTAAVRPSAIGNDVLIADLLLDDTGKVHGGFAGVSVTRALRVAPTYSGAPINPSGHETTDYSLVRSYEPDTTTAVKLREYVGFDGTAPVFVRTINAQWVGVQGLWYADNPALPAHLREETIDSEAWYCRTAGGASWTNNRHDPGGWDFAKVEESATNGSVSMDGQGVIIGNGGQTAVVAVSGEQPSTVIDLWGAFTWPQQMAASPSSVTLSSAGPSDTNVSSASTFALSVYGGLFQVAPTATGATYCARKIVSVP